jgi:diguanylate cyclase (GGDEF)-like protein
VLMAKQVIVFCSNYSRELEALSLAENYGDIEVIYFPSRCGMPPIAWSKFKEQLPELGDDQELHVVSCGGLTGLNQKQLIADRHYNYDFKQCYHLITSPDLAEYYIQKGFYLVSPGWLAHWRGILEGWGFNQPTAIKFFKDTTRAILLLDTGVDPAAETNLQEFAGYIGLPHETVSVGLDYLKLLLSNTVLKSRVENSSQVAKEKLSDHQKEFADFAMALDLLNTLARVRQEESVLESMKHMFHMLFAPQVVNFTVADRADSASNPAVINDEDSFRVPVQGSSGLLGYLEIIGVNQPRHLAQYKRLADKIVNICGLAIENARHYQTIKDLSDTDGLTGIANRRKLEEHLAQEWRRLLRDKKPLTLMMCDIDYFKRYNDLYGHQAGDDCLKAVAGVLTNHSQRSGDLAARYGGEEFTLVLPAVEKEGAAKLAEKIRHDVEALQLKHEGSPISSNVTLSIGVACQVPTTESATEKLIAVADSALYQTKASGRNRVIMA